ERAADGLVLRPRARSRRLRATALRTARATRRVFPRLSTTGGRVSGGSMSAKLAIFGHPPAFDAPLHVGRPNLPDKAAVLKRVADVLDSGWLTNGGPLVQEFERRLAEQTGAKHCLAVSN